ncbi:MAG: hypothetical protein QW820_06995 [Sulfolobales archaeon]
MKGKETQEKVERTISDTFEYIRIDIERAVSRYVKDDTTKTVLLRDIFDLLDYYETDLTYDVLKIIARSGKHD